MLIKMTPLLLCGTAVGLFLTASAAQAVDFTVSSGQTVTTTQTLSDPNDAGTVETGGAIETSGGDLGIDASASGVTILNDGSITTSGGSGYGIRSTGSGATITNNGSIKTTGYAAMGIRATGADTTVTNTGTITTTALASAGILSNGTGVTIVNSGSILVTSGVDAILSTQANATLTLLPGSVIQGDITFSSPGSATLNIGKGLQTALTFSGVPTTINTNGQPYVVSGSSVAVVDPTIFAGLDAATLSLTRSLAGVLDNRMAPKNADAMTTGAIPGDAPASRNGIWGAGFGAYSLRPTSGSDEGYTTGAGGLVLGIDRPVSATDMAGGYVGLSVSGVKTEVGSSSAQSKGLFAGAYWGHDDGSAFADLSVTGGGLSSNTDRTVANNQVSGGLETASGSFAGFYVSPAITVGLHADMNGMKVSPSLRLRYTGLYNQGYTETGSSANLTVQERIAHSVELRGQIKADLATKVGPEGVSTLSVRSGVDGVLTDNGTVDATLLGSGLSFAAGSNRSEARAFVGGDATFAGVGGTVFKAGFEAGYDTTRTLSVGATASIHGTF